MKLFFSLALFVLVPTAMFCRDIYIVYDENCMDRLEYSYESANGEASYVAYHINLDANEKIILEIGRESDRPQRYVPSNFWRCDNTDFSLELVQSVNQNADQIYLVRSLGRKRHLINKVRVASHYKLENEVIRYFSPKYRFEFDLQAGTIGENIAYEDPRSEVYFEGRLDNECSGAYIFRQYSRGGNNPPHTDIVLVPEIGVIEERSGDNLDDAFQNMLNLSSVNGVTVRSYLNRLCGDGEMEEELVMGPEEESNQPANSDLPVEEEFVEKTPGNITGGGEALLPNNM